MRAFFQPTVCVESQSTMAANGWLRRYDRVGSDERDLGGNTHLHLFHPTLLTKNPLHLRTTLAFNTPQRSTANHHLTAVRGRQHGTVPVSVSAKPPRIQYGSAGIQAKPSSHQFIAVANLAIGSGKVRHVHSLILSAAQSLSVTLDLPHGGWSGRMQDGLGGL